MLKDTASQQLGEEALIAGWLVLDAAHRDKSRHFSDREESPFYDKYSVNLIDKRCLSKVDVV